MAELGASCSTRCHEWVPVGLQRDSAGLVEQVLRSVRMRRRSTPRTPLVTHRLREQVVREDEETIGRPA